MKVQAYLSFKGNCQEALNYYGDLFDAEVVNWGKYTGDSFPSLQNFSGNGSYFNLDVGLIGSAGYGFWQSDAGDWKGNKLTVGMSLGAKLFDVGNSKTTIEFPVLNNKYDLNHSQWNLRKLSDEEITPIIKQ